MTLLTHKILSTLTCVITSRGINIHTNFAQYKVMFNLKSTKIQSTRLSILQTTLNIKYHINKMIGEKVENINKTVSELGG